MFISKNKENLIQKLKRWKYDLEKFSEKHVLNRKTYSKLITNFQENIFMKKDILLIRKIYS